MAAHSIVILGGGTAGWMAANLMAHHWRQKSVEITLVESPSVGTVGVGEGSTPTLKRFFEDLSIAESEWMPACRATYKASIRFVGWSPGSGIESYSHPFISQPDAFSERPFHVNCLTRRLGLDVVTDPERFLFNGWLAKQQLAPKAADNFPFRVEYGYHFDSALLGEFLKAKAEALGVKHLALNVTDAVLDTDEAITQLRSREGLAVEGDFFVDCSGFRALLIQQTLAVPFESFGDNLFNDAAVTLPSDALPNTPVETRSTALSAGWAWQIPLTHRTGNGYVYSRGYRSADDAETELRRHLGLLDSPVEARHLAMKVGQVSRHWQANCLALGLSQGFIEPLEATALHLVQLGIEFFIAHYERGNFSPLYRDDYNTLMRERFDRVRDYIVAHYKLNTRDDSDYWRDNRANMALSESLLNILDVWYRQGDLPAEIARQQLNSHFGSTSWHCLLAGYGVFPPLANDQPGSGDMLQAHEIERMWQGCMLNFPDHSSALSKFAL